MKKIFVESLALIVTEKCNLNCAHCLRGEKQNRDISKEVVNATLDQIGAIGMLNICGGEPTLVPYKIGYIFREIIKRKIYVEEVAITINGTIYDEKFLDFCILMDNYIKNVLENENGGVSIYISDDIYHKTEMYLRDITWDKRYLNSYLFAGTRNIDDNLKILNVGNATNLDSDLTLDFRPMKYIVADFTRKNFSLSHRVGPLVSINIDGTITEDNVPYTKQQNEYNYGNVLKDNIVDALIEHGAKVVKSDLQYRILDNIERHKFLTYKK